MQLSATMPRVQIIVPVYNEGDGILQLYDSLVKAGVEFDSLKFIYDFDADTTVPFIAKLHDQDERVGGERNDFGRGAVNALRWGFSRAQPGPVIVVMGDNSDTLDIVPKMVNLWRSGATIVSPSRYMKGGAKHGGGFIKTMMSRIACVSLKMLGFPTADATNNFKLYDGTWLREQSVDSLGGFEVAIELTYKAFRERKTIVELPTVWTDRTAGESKFQILKWLPQYLKWYFKCLGVLVLRLFRIR